jgi:hypothetical protein
VEVADGAGNVTSSEPAKVIVGVPNGVGASDAARGPVV